MNDPGDATYRRFKIHPTAAHLLGELGDAPEGVDLRGRLMRMIEQAEPSPTGRDLEAALRTHRWLLDRAAGDGLPLTAAGYLKPALVKELAEVLPTMAEFPFPVSREVDAHPVQAFRRHVQEIGLLRRRKDALVLTPAGRAAQVDPLVLWQVLGERLVPDIDYPRLVRVALMLHMATEPERRPDMRAVARAMGLLGWRLPDGPVTESNIWPVYNDLWHALGNVGPLLPQRIHDRIPGPAAISLIRDALLHQVPLDS